MISEAAVEAFINRDLPDLSIIKRRSEKELRRRYNRLRPKPGVKTDLYAHQIATFLVCERMPGLNVWLDMGGGKTLTMLTLIEWRIRRGEIDRAMVLVPLSANLNEWADQIEQHTNLTYEVLDGSRAERIAGLEGDAQVVVVTYAGFLHLVSNKVEEWKTVRGRRKKVKKLRIDKSICRALGRAFGFWVCDESTFIKNREAESWKAVNACFKFTRYRYLMTGTPYNVDPQDLWAQFKLVDGGETLGKTLGLFRAAFCREVVNPFNPWPEYEFDKRKTKMLRRFSRACSIRYRDTEMTELPPVVGGLLGDNLMMRRVEFSKEAGAYYDKFIADFQDGKKAVRPMENTWVLMRSLTSGYLAAVDEKGQRVDVMFKDNPKLDSLVELLGEADPSRQIIVACYYKPTVRMVTERLKKEGFAPLQIYGDTSAGQRKEALRAFRAGESRVMVASTAIAYGMNLQTASIIAMFETPSSPVERKQLEKRVHRHGQKNRCYIYDLVVKGTVDEAIVFSMKKGQDLFERLIEGRDVKTLFG